MCDGFSELMLGAAAVGGTEVGVGTVTAGMSLPAAEAAMAGGLSAYTIPGAAATTGLFGTGGAFALAPTLGTMGLGSSLLGIGMSIFGQQQSVAAQKAAAKYQAQVASNNARIALDNGRVAEQTQRMKTAALIGAQRTTMAANGVELDSGSPLDIQSDAARLGELDALTIRHIAENTASSYRAQAGLSSAQAGYAQQAGNIGAATSLLSGASSVADKWGRYKTGGVF